MSKGNATETDVLNHIFLATALPWAGNSKLFLALHTADPGEAGNQTTNEVSYTNYDRIGVDRNSGGWTVSGNTATNTALLQFPQCGGGSAAATHVTIGTATSGAGQIVYSGALNATLNVSNLIQPQFPAQSLTVAED